MAYKIQCNVSPARGIGWIMLATLVFAVVPVRDDTTGTWSFGVLKNPEQFFVVLGFGLLGLMLYRYLCGIWRQNSRFAQRMTAAVLVFACVFSMVHIGIGKFGQWHTDSDLVEHPLFLARYILHPKNLEELIPFWDNLL